MILSEVEILKSTRLARAVVIAEKLNENEAFLNPPGSPIDWLKDQVRAVTGIFASAPPSKGEADRGSQHHAGGDAAARRRLPPSGSAAASSSRCRSAPMIPNSSARSARAYADAYLSDHLNANFDATQRATVWLQGRIGELRDRSQAAALEVETFRAENGLTAARGELMSEQQLSDLNSQLIVAQADTANALARYTQYKSIIDSGPENAVKNATIPTDKANSSVLNELKTRYLNITKREQDVTTRFGRRPSAGGGAAPRTGRCDTADLPGAAATHRELSQRIRGREIARDIVAQQCRRHDGPEFAIEPVDGAAARTRAEVDGARHALPVVSGALRGSIAAAFVSDRPGACDLASRQSRRRRPVRARRWCLGCRWCWA